MEVVPDRYGRDHECGVVTVVSHWFWVPAYEWTKALAWQKYRARAFFDYEMVKMHKSGLTNAAKIGILYIVIKHFE